MMKRRFVVAGLIGLLSACASSSGFVSSWKSPTAKPMQVTGSKVAAVVMMGDDAMRRSAEDKLASEITARGANGVPAYTLMDEGPTMDEATAKEALQKAGVLGVVVVRPSKEDSTGKPVDYSVPPYSSYWDQGYYAHGWGKPWISPEGVPYDLVVSVDTLIYSLPQNQLVWAGKSKKTNPATLNELVADLADDTAMELNRLELVKK